MTNTPPDERAEIAVASQSEIEIAILDEEIVLRQELDGEVSCIYLSPSNVERLVAALRRFSLGR